jgi:multiple sugar transport system permease protein
MNLLIALTVNLAGMLVIYSLMAFALVRLGWHRRGIMPVLVTIIMAGIFWSAPTSLAFFLAAFLGEKGTDALPYSLWLGNWLVSGFSVVILCQRARGIPRQLEDSARLDGCGWFGTYWHALLPLVRRELGLIGFLTLMATSVLCLMALSMVGSHRPFFPPWLELAPISGDSESTPSLVRFLGAMTAGSIAVTLPVMLVFFFSERCYLRPVRLRNDS